MSDATADAVHEAARRAVDAWITTGDEKSGRRLRDCLHALSVAGTNRRRPLADQSCGRLGNLRPLNFS